jgi:hypothetical protein
LACPPSGGRSGITMLLLLALLIIGFVLLSGVRIAQE